MAMIKEIYAYIAANWYGILMAGSVILMAAEFVVRLTPTKKDDGFVKRLADAYAKLFDLLKVPNIKKKDGAFIVPDGLHKPKK
jgi:hypothetical protein